MTNTSISLLEKYVGLICCALLTLGRRTSAFVAKEDRVNDTTKKIVFVKFIEQGALVLHQNAFKEAVAQYGLPNVYLCTFASNAQMVDTLAVIRAENKIVINEKSLWQFTKGFVQALIQIRKNRIDTAIDLEFFSCATAVFCYLTGATKRAGYHRFKGSQNYRGDLFTHKLSYSHYVHVAASSWCLLKSLELPVENLPALNIPINHSPTEISFRPNQRDLDRFKTLVGLNPEDSNPIIVINPSLNDVLPLRKWPANQFIDFIEKIKDRFPNYSFVFTGRPDEREKTDQLIQSTRLRQAVNLCGKTEFRDILTLYSCARLLVTSDSGPAHFAAMTSVDTIVLFGPETPALYAPLSDRTHVIYNGLPCSPCYNVYNNRLSPCQMNLCMQSISVDQVMQTVLRVFNERDGLPGTVDQLETKTGTGLSK
jgi:ADP-heptose:LPS heptosyltransferase